MSKNRHKWEKVGKAIMWKCENCHNVFMTTKKDRFKPISGCNLVDAEEMYKDIKKVEENVKKEDVDPLTKAFGKLFLEMNKNEEEYVNV